LTVTASRSFFELTSSSPKAVDGRHSEAASAPETSPYEAAKYDATIAALERVRNPHVTFERREIPEDYPAGDFDLVIASEVLYYLDPLALEDTIRRFAGTLVTVHWRGPTERYPFTGDEVHHRLTERFGAPAYSAWTDKYALDRWDACGS